jgi:streptogramin lyase
MVIISFVFVLTIKPLSVLVITVFALAFLSAFYVLFIAHNNTNDDEVYGQESNKFPHSFAYSEYHSDHKKNSDVQFVGMPLNITILEYKSNRTNNSININSNTTKNSNLTSETSTITTSSRQEGFRKGFCGINSTTSGYSDYVLEYKLPQSCEMPLGIAVDSQDKEVWYVSTKRGILGMYDITENKFEQHTIPQWYVRENPRGFSQVWDMKIDNENDGESDEIWFTDTAQNAIWRFKKTIEQFEVYRIPAQSESFGTTYPITINIVGNKSIYEGSDDGENVKNKEGKSIYFIGTFAPSLWYAKIDELRNGTANGIHEIKLPVEYGFKNIDPFYVTSGSFEFDEDRNSAWISMLSYSRKGQIVEYDLDSKTFNIFGLPDDLSSPLGIVVVDNNDLNDNNQGDTTELWITNPGTSIFYNYGLSEEERKKNDNEINLANQTEGSDQNSRYNVNIERYTTLTASPRIFGMPFYDIGNDSDNRTRDDDLRNGYYTLPSWIKRASDGSIWFNQQQGNKISKFDPSEQELIEYWIPSQNNEWGNCEEDKRSDVPDSIGQSQNRMRNCGIANVLNFALMESDEREEDEEDDMKDAVGEVWFTEWSTNKIGRIDVTKDLPFDIEIQESDRDLTVKRGESDKIKMVVVMDPKYENDEDDKQTSITDLSKYDDLITMRAAGTFTSTGYLGNSSGYFDVPLNSFDKDENDNDDNNIEQEVSFLLTPSQNTIPGEYTLMLGAEDESVSISKAVKINVI